MALLIGCERRPSSFPAEPDPPFRPYGAPQGGRPRALAVDGSMVYVAAGQQVVEVDVGDPSHPVEVAAFDGRHEVIEDVAIAGDQLLTVDSGLSLGVFDLGKASSPHPLHRISMPLGGPPESRMHPRTVAARDGLAFVAGEIGPAASRAGVGSPAQPAGSGESEASAAIDSAPNGPAATATAVAAAASGRVDRSGAASRLVVFDVSRPEAPRPLGKVDFPGRAVDLALAGDHAYVAAGQGGLRVIDIHDPDRPRQVAYAPSPANAVGVAVAGGHAFVAEDDPAGSGLQVIDVRNPAAPVEVASARLARRNAAVPVAVRGVAAGQGRAWLATSDGLRTVDVADPAAPRELSATDESATAAAPGSSLASAGSAALALTPVGDRLYVLDLTRGLEVLAQDEAGTWQAIGEWPALTRVTDVRVLPSAELQDGSPQPSRLLAVSAGRPVLLDALGPADLLAAGRRGTVQPIVLPGRLHAFTLDGSRLYATVIVPPADPNATVETLSLVVVDLDWPGGPRLKAEVPLTDYTFDPASIASLEDTVWLKLRDGAWLVVDAVDSGSARLIGRIARTGRGEILTVSDGRLIALSNDPRSGAGQLEVLDPADPLRPALLGRAEIAPDPLAVAVRGDLAYVAAREVLQVLDLATPSAPRLVGTLRLDQSPRAIALRDVGDRLQAVLALGEQGLLAVDVTDPASPQALGGWSSPAFGVAAEGDEVHLAGGDLGLELLKP